MNTLQAAAITLELQPARPHGLAALGVPPGAETVVRQGRRGEAMQALDDGRIGRRYQNLRATLVSACEGGVPLARLLLQFELFGDDCAPLEAPAGLTAQVRAGDRLLAELALGRPCLPFAGCWYDHLLAAPLAPADAAAADAVVLLAPAEPVRLLPSAVG